jgi:hypothetical protein
MLWAHHHKSDTLGAIFGVQIEVESVAYRSFCTSSHATTRCSSR